MRNTLKYTLLSLIKEKTILIWALAFPLILATLFNFMFANLDDAFNFAPIPVAAVDNTQYHNAEAFVRMIDVLAKPGDDQTLVLYSVKSVAEAEQLLAEREVVGYFLVNGKGDPELFVTTPETINGIDTVNQTILKNILDNYLRSRATIETIIEMNPLALSDPSIFDSFFERTSYTEEISILANNASNSVRYFYALLGFSTIMIANVGMMAVTRTQANLSALGARRSLGATSRFKTMTATLLSSWLLSFFFLLIAYCYMRYVFGINFGNDAVSIFGLFIASLVTTSLGACVGAIPKLVEGAKAGILTGLTCVLSLFAGLFGQASMRLADNMVRIAPWFQAINPAKRVTDLFYSLYYYDGYDQFFGVVVSLLAIAVVLFVCTSLLVRRQRYASL